MRGRALSWPTAWSTARRASASCPPNCARWSSAAWPKTPASGPPQTRCWPKRAPCSPRPAGPRAAFAHRTSARRRRTSSRDSAGRRPGRRWWRPLTAAGVTAGVPGGVRRGQPRLGQRGPALNRGAVRAAGRGSPTQRRAALARGPRYAAGRAPVLQCPGPEPAPDIIPVVVTVTRPPRSRPPRAPSGQSPLPRPRHVPVPRPRRRPPTASASPTASAPRRPLRPRRRARQRRPHCPCRRLRAPGTYRQGTVGLLRRSLRRSGPGRPGLRLHGRQWLSLGGGDLSLLRP